jgi:hypothetical protein
MAGSGGIDAQLAQERRRPLALLPLNREEVAAWGGRWNVDMDYFIDQMDGSP